MTEDTRTELSIWQRLSRLAGTSPQRVESFGPEHSARSARSAREAERQAERRAVLGAFHEAWGRAKVAPRRGDGTDYDKRAFEHVQFWLDQTLNDRSSY